MDRAAEHVDVPRDATIVESLLASGMRGVSPKLIDWLGEAQVRRNMRAAIMKDLRDPAARRAAVNDRLMLATAGTHIDAMPIPHVLVTQRSFDVQSDQDLRDVASAARAFTTPSPRRVGFYLAGQPGRDSVVRGHAAIVPYKRYLVAPASLILDARPADASRLVIREATDLSFYDEYSRMYDEFHDDVPALRDHVRKELPEDLQAFRDAGVVSLVEVDGRLAGVMAAVPGCEHGLRGWVMKERVFTRPFRGGGLGAAALWAFIRALPLGANDLVWGTIVPENHASIRSALKLGRVDTGGWFWIELERLS
jgi:hypothetical protein